MNKIKIKLISIGHLPIDFQLKKISRWTSSVFEVVDGFDNIALRCDSDGQDWEFSDQLIQGQIPKNFDADFMIAIVNVPIQDNYYCRRLENNTVVVTFHEIREILEHHNIPIENVIFRLMYACALQYKKFENKIPSNKTSGLTHDETRGCIYDMNGVKRDLVASCDTPIICDECQEKLKSGRVSTFLIKSTQNEISRIRKDLYYRFFSFVRKHPILSLLLSGFIALVIGTTGSIIASFIYDGIKDNR